MSDSTISTEITVSTTETSSTLSTKSSSSSSSFQIITEESDNSIEQTNHCQQKTCDENDDNRSKSDLITESSNDIVRDNIDIFIHQFKQIYTSEKKRTIEKCKKVI